MADFETYIVISMPLGSSEITLKTVDIENLECPICHEESLIPTTIGPCGWNPQSPDDSFILFITRYNHNEKCSMSKSKNPHAHVLPKSRFLIESDIVGQDMFMLKYVSDIKDDDRRIRTDANREDHRTFKEYLKYRSSSMMWKRFIDAWTTLCETWKMFKDIFE